MRLAHLLAVHKNGKSTGDQALANSKYTGNRIHADMHRNASGHMEHPTHKRKNTHAITHLSQIRMHKHGYTRTRKVSAIATLIKITMDLTYQNEM